MKGARRYKSDEDEPPQRWNPPKLKSMDPNAGPVAGGQKVRIEFEEAIPYKIISVKFGDQEVKEEEIDFKPPSKILLVKTPESAYGRLGKVKIKISTDYHHRFELSQEYEYVLGTATPVKAASRGAKATPKKPSLATLAESI
jgi:hypothetical protein